MGEGQLFDPASAAVWAAGAGGVLALECHLRFGMGKGGFVDQQIGAAGQLNRCFTEHRVGAVHHAHPGAGWATEIAPINGAPIVRVTVRPCCSSP